MATDEQEKQFIQDALIAARAARPELIKRAATGNKVVQFEALRQLDMDIKTCENELRRSKC